MTTITHEHWTVEELEDFVRFSNRKRSGNRIETIDVTRGDFLSLYNVILAVGQLHPEWLQ